MGCPGSSYSSFLDEPGAALTGQSEERDSSRWDQMAESLGPLVETGLCSEAGPVWHYHWDQWWGHLGGSRKGCRPLSGLLRVWGYGTALLSPPGRRASPPVLSLTPCGSRGLPRIGTEAAEALPCLGMGLGVCSCFLGLHGKFEVSGFKNIHKHHHRGSSATRSPVPNL